MVDKWRGPPEISIISPNSGGEIISLKRMLVLFTILRAYFLTVKRFDSSYIFDGKISKKWWSKKPKFFWSQQGNNASSKPLRLATVRKLLHQPIGSSTSVHLLLCKITRIALNFGHPTNKKFQWGKVTYTIKESKK